MSDRRLIKVGATYDEFHVSTMSAIEKDRFKGNLLKDALRKILDELILILIANRRKPVQVVLDFEEVPSFPASRREILGWLEIQAIERREVFHPLPPSPFMSKEPDPRATVAIATRIIKADLDAHHKTKRGRIVRGKSKAKSASAEIVVKTSVRELREKLCQMVGQGLVNPKAADVVFASLDKVLSTKNDAEILAFCHSFFIELAEIKSEHEKNPNKLASHEGANISPKQDDVPL